MIPVFVVNGSDYSLIIIGAICAILTFVIQLFLCFKAKRTGIKLIPLYFTLLLCVLAAVTALFGGSPDSFMDLSGLVAVVIFCIALLFGISTGAAWLIYKVKTRK